MFKYIENVFSDFILHDLKSYCTVLATDKSSYSVWPGEATDNNNLVECFTSDLVGSPRARVITHLHQHEILHHKMLKVATFAVQKIPPGGTIPAHSDSCLMSLTVFLSDVDGGGEFVSEGIAIKPKYNCGIFYKNDAQQEGPRHSVSPVSGTKTRYTLQMFIWDNDKDISAKIS